jgi:ankyrin repeat protein
MSTTSNFSAQQSKLDPELIAKMNQHTLVSQLVRHYCNETNGSSHITRGSILDEAQKKINETIAIGGDVNACDSDSKTALHIAVEHDNEEFVTFLLKNHKADPNGLPTAADPNQIYNRLTPLAIACKEGQISPNILNHLIQNGADVNRVFNITPAKHHDAMDMNPLMIAALGNEKDNSFKIELLLKHGATLNKALLDAAVTKQTKPSGTFFDLVLKHRPVNAATLLTHLAQMNPKKRDAIVASTNEGSKSEDEEYESESE